MGYGVALVAAFAIWVVISNIIDERESVADERHKKYWRVAQWCSTMFLWSQWLMHDMANIVVYLPRQLDLTMVAGVISVLVVFLGIIFYTGGGRIQNIVVSKTGTRYIRSATIIDLVFAFVLFFFKELNDIPMSTTWVFVGLLAGRELAISYVHQRRFAKKKRVFPVLVSDFLKIMAGLGISVLLAMAVVNFA